MDVDLQSSSRDVMTILDQLPGDELVSPTSAGPGTSSAAR